MIDIRPLQASDAPAFRALRLAALAAHPTAFASSVEDEADTPLATLAERRARLSVPGVRDFLGYGAMWRDFLSALRERREAAMTLAMARRDLAIVEEAYRTAGIPVHGD